MFFTNAYRTSASKECPEYIFFNQFKATNVHLTETIASCTLTSIAYQINANLLHKTECAKVIKQKHSRRVRKHHAVILPSPFDILIIDYINQETIKIDR